MTLTELQLPDKQTFYSNVRVIADEVYRMMERWEAAYKFLEGMSTADMDAIGISAMDGVRTDLIDLRVLLSEFVDLWNNTSVTPTKNPKTVVDEIRHMNVI